MKGALKAGTSYGANPPPVNDNEEPCVSRRVELALPGPPWGTTLPHCVRTWFELKEQVTASEKRGTPVGTW